MVKKSVFVLVAATTLAAVPLAAQTGWMKTYGGDQADGGYQILSTSDDGYIIVGRTASLGNEAGDIWLLRTDASGDTLWTRTYGGENSDGSWCIHETSEGGYIIAGITESFGAGNSDVWLLKTDENGDTIWSKTYGEENYDAAFSIDQTADDGYIITGYKDGVEDEESGYAHEYNLWLLKIDSNGDTSWTRTYGDENTLDMGNCVRQTDDGGYIIAGSALYSEATFTSVVLMKTDENGDSLWTYRTGAQLMCVLQTADDAYVAAGIKRADLVLLKVGEAGNLLWEHTWGASGYGNDWGACLQETSDGGYIITGTYAIIFYTDGTSEDGDAWLLKTDAQGDTLWTRTYGSNPMRDDGLWVQQTSDGGYIITGITETYGHRKDDRDLWLIKTDEHGMIAVEEGPIVDTSTDWEILTAVGQRIVLRYEDRPQGFRASVFDAAGRKVDEIRSAESSGTITWPATRQSPGVYFIKVESPNNVGSQKIIIIQ